MRDLAPEELAYLQEDAVCTCGHAEALHFDSNDCGPGSCRLLACDCREFEDANPKPAPPAPDQITLPPASAMRQYNTLLTKTWEHYLPEMRKQFEQELILRDWFKRKAKE